MSEEEKEAIEYLKTRLYGNEGCKYIDVTQEDLRIFINLIDRLQKEKEEMRGSAPHTARASRHQPAKTSRTMFCLFFLLLN